MPQTREEIARKQRERRKRYQGTCVDCGSTTDGSSGFAAPQRCYRCEPRSRMTWSPAMIIEAIRLFDHRYGHPPSAADFNPSHARSIGRDDWADRFHRDGDYPPTTACQREFGTWSKAIEAAGFTSRPIGVHGPRRERA